jgi:transketolase
MTQNPNPALVKEMTSAVRILSAEAIEKAKSGHPGAPMGMAEIAEVLWNRHYRHNPKNPQWANRDRFVLSNGHGSMLLYALLYLTGYELSLDDIKAFRQLHSKTPGHPEWGITPGVETTTGPLGQGLANAVGMALAEKLLALEFNQSKDGESFDIVDHMTYAFVGDGCLMEGISHEVCSLAGTLRLSKLVVFYDDNGISIDGDVSGWFLDDTPARFRAYGWHVITALDGHDSQVIDLALQEALAQSRLPEGKPTLICCKTIIGQGAPNKAGSHEVHGSALGAEELKATKQALGWDHPSFEIPDRLLKAWDARQKGQAYEKKWQDHFDRYSQYFPEKAREFTRRMAGQLPLDFSEKLNDLCAIVAQREETIATRKASQNALDLLSPILPELFGGSADLTGSNLTNFKNHQKASRDHWGNHLSYGVREFGMAAMMNGMTLHGGYIPYGGTFLTFSDYSRNAIRMAALMKQRVIHVFTHDSIGLGEDGPTHQSIEHCPSLRLIPNLDLWRPADGLETLVAWSYALDRKEGPSALALSRQNVPKILHHTNFVSLIRKGGYILSDRPQADCVIIATGSEVSLALEAQKDLDKLGVAVRVVSMPCTSLFDRQSQDYRESVVPLSLPVIAIEAAHPDFWYKYVGRKGRVIGIDHFGESAPASVLYDYFKITSHHLCEAVQDLLR